MNLSQLRSFKPKILSLAEEHGVGNVRVFGSVARGEADDSGTKLDYRAVHLNTLSNEIQTIPPKARVY